MATPPLPLPSLSPEEILSLLPTPPFASPYAILGETPTKDVDIPIASIFLVLYACAGIIDLLIFRHNQKRGHRFFWTEMMVSLCVARVITMSLRITESIYPSNLRLALATNIFVLAGVLILIAINLIFTERIITAMHPKMKRPITIVFKTLETLIPVALMILICSYVLQAYTLDPYTKETEFDAQRGGSCYLLFLAFLPLPALALSFVLPNKRNNIENFGTGSWYGKVVVLVVGATLLTLGAAFRVSVSFMPPNPVAHPAWYDSRACFWIFNFTIEITVIYLYIVTRVDKRFHVPNRVQFVEKVESRTGSEDSRVLHNGDGMKIYVAEEDV